LSILLGIFFFLEYTGELHIFVLRRRKIGPLQTPSPHSRPSCERLRYNNDVVLKLKETLRGET
jgi:hypothetical protein